MWTDQPKTFEQAMHVSTEFYAVIPKNRKAIVVFAYQIRKQASQISGTSHHKNHLVENFLNRSIPQEKVVAPKMLLCPEMPC